MGTLVYDRSVGLFWWVFRFKTDQWVYLDGYSGIWRISGFIWMSIPVYDRSADLFWWVFRFMTGQGFSSHGYFGVWRLSGLIWWVIWLMMGLWVHYQGYSRLWMVSGSICTGNPNLIALDGKRVSIWFHRHRVSLTRQTEMKYWMRLTVYM